MISLQVKVVSIVSMQNPEFELSSKCVTDSLNHSRPASYWPNVKLLYTYARNFRLSIPESRSTDITVLVLVARSLQAHCLSVRFVKKAVGVERRRRKNRGALGAKGEGCGCRAKYVRHHSILGD